MALNQDAAFSISANVSGQSAVDSLIASLKQLGNTGQTSAGQIRNAMRALPAQFTDIATQLQGGQSPLTVLMQQGGQIKDMFGGIGPAVAGVGRYLATLLTPTTAVAAAFAALGYAAYKGSEQTAELNRQLLLTGGAAGKTAGEIENMAVRLRNSVGVTAGAARDMATQLAATGAFGPDTIETAAQAMLKIQKLSQQSTAEIVKDFASMAGGVAQWAAAHNRAYNYLTADQFRYIKQLEAMGNTEAAMRENMRLLDAAFAKREENLGTLEKAWKSLKEMASSAWDAMLNVGRENPEKELESTRKAVAALEEAIAENTKRGTVDPARQRAAQDELFRLKALLGAQQREIERAQKTAADTAKQAAKEQQKIQEEASGVASGIRAAQNQKALADISAQAAEQLRMTKRQIADLDFEYANGLMSETEYTNRKIALRKRELQEQADAVDKEIALERKRAPENKVDAANKPVKVAQLQAKAAELRGQAALEEASATGQAARAYALQTKTLDEQAAAQGRSNLEVQIAAARQEALNQGLGRTPELYEKLVQQRIAALTAMNDRSERKAVEDFTTKVGDEIKTLQLEGEASRMSTLEHRIRTEQLKLDAEAQKASKDMTDQGKAAMLDAADAAKKLIEQQIRLNYEQSRTFGAGAQEAFRDYIDSATNAAQQAKTLFGNAFRGMEDALVKFVQTGKLDFKSLADSIISDMIRIVIQQRITGPLAAAFGSFLGPSNYAYGTTTHAEALAAGTIPLANGGVVSAAGMMPLHAYASGGIATRPQLALFGEGRMPEAFVPLPDGRRIPVAMQGGGGQSVTVNVVNNAGNANATAQERQDSQGNRIIDVMIEQVKASIAADISRGVGTVTSALEKTYGANRAAGAY